MVKFALELAMKTRSGSRRVAVFFLEPQHWMVWVSMPRHHRSTPGMTWYALYRKLGGSQGPSKWVRNISPHQPPSGFDPRDVQLVASLGICTLLVASLFIYC
jgi:hypothetical protein